MNHAMISNTELAELPRKCCLQVTGKHTWRCRGKEMMAAGSSEGYRCIRPEEGPI